MKNKILNFIIFLFIFECTPILNNLNVLIKDKNFIKLESELISSENDFSQISYRKYRNYKKNLKTANDWNNLAIIQIIKKKIDLAEKSFSESSKLAPKDSNILLNQIRFYYLLNQYDLAKEKIRIYLEAILYKESELKNIENSLELTNRKEELVLFWDVISSNPKFRVGSFEKLGIYFLQKNNPTMAYYYFDQILMTHPFHIIARYSMAKLAHDLEKWEDCIVYSKSLIETENYKKDVYYFLVRSYYEEGETKEAMRWILKTPNSEKIDIHFLQIWKKILIIQKQDLEPLTPYLEKLKDTGYYVNVDEFLNGKMRK